MLDLHVGFYVLLCLCTLTGIVVGLRSGWSNSLGVAMATSFLAPVWVELNAFGIPINIRTSVAIIFLLGFCIHSAARVFKPWSITDFLIAGLVIWHVCCDYYHGESVVMASAVALGEWALPYMAGRNAFLHRESLVKLAPWFTFSAIVLATAAIFESLTGVNVWDHFLVSFADGVDDVTRPSTKRYGLLYRATATTRHPIFLGVILVLMIPWLVATLELIRNSGRRIAWSVVSIGIVALGIIATVSRGPMLELIAVAGLVAAIKFTWVRWAILPLVAISCLALVVAPQKTLDSVEALTGDVVNRPVLKIDQKAEIFSSTRGRLMVTELYWPALMAAGPIGYGTEDTSGKHPNLPYQAKYRQLYNQLESIDNSWLYLALRFGWVGLIIFACLYCSVIATAWKTNLTASTYLYPNGTLFTTTIIATLVATAIQILTVYTAYDFMFWIIFQFGVVESLRFQVLDRIFKNC